MFKKILLTTDGSKCSETAAEYAILIAGQNNAKITVLNVLETYSLAGLPVEDFTRKVNEIFRQEGKKDLDNINKIFEDQIKQKRFRNKIKLVLMTKEGSPAEVILQTVEEENIDLVVMGASGKHAVERFILGSVAEKVVRHAKCPVLTVH